MASILLLQNAPGIGKKGEIVTVKDGYAANFILPRRIGRIATMDDVRAFESAKTAKTTQISKKDAIAAKLAGMPHVALVKMAVPIEVETASGGKVYAQISENMIIDAALKKFDMLEGFDKSELTVHLAQKIEFAGKYGVQMTITLHGENGIQKFAFPLYIDVVSISEAKRKSQ